MKRRKWKPLDHQIAIANKVIDVIFKTSSGDTKAFNILLQLLLSIFSASIMNGDFWIKTLNNQMLVTKVLS